MNSKLHEIVPQLFIPLRKKIFRTTFADRWGEGGRFVQKWISSFAAGSKIGPRDKSGASIRLNVVGRPSSTPSIFHPLLSSIEWKITRSPPRIPTTHPPGPGVTNRCFWFTISHCQCCIHACINEIFNSIWREIGFHTLRGYAGNTFPPCYLDPRLSLVNVRWAARYCFPYLFCFRAILFFSSFSFEFYFKMELYVSLRRNLLNEMLDSLGILLAECIVIILHKCIVIILYCSSKLCFVEFENNGIE